MRFWMYLYPRSRAVGVIAAEVLTPVQCGFTVSACGEDPPERT